MKRDTWNKHAETKRTRFGEVIRTRVETEQEKAEEWAAHARRVWTGCTVRTYRRSVSADYVPIQVWIVVVRSKTAPEARTENSEYARMEARMVRPGVFEED